MQQTPRSSFKHLLKKAQRSRKREEKFVFAHPSSFFFKQTRRPKKWRGSRARPCHACLCASEMWGSLRGFVRHELWGLRRVSAGSEGAGALHRLNRLGATAACSSRMRECILGRRWHFFESWRVSEGGRCRHVFVQPLLSWAAADEEGCFFFIQAFFLAHAHTHTRTQMSLANTFLWGSHAFWCNYTLDEWAQAGTSCSLWVCICFCVCVSPKWSIVFCTLLEGSSLLTCCLHFGASHCHRNLRPPWSNLKARSAGMSLVFVPSQGGKAF